MEIYVVATVDHEMSLQLYVLHTIPDVGPCSNSIICICSITVVTVQSKRQPV